MIFDVYIPSMAMIFEYQGYQHFYDHHIFGYAKARNECEDERRDGCKFQGITYVEVPYWWRRDKSIIAILHKHRTDIITSSPEVTPFVYK